MDGKVQLIVIEASDPKAVRAEGAENTFMSISKIRKVFADVCKDGVYSLRGPDNLAHQFTLEPWSRRDPDKTFLQISFRSTVPEAFSKRLPFVP